MRDILYMGFARVRSSCSAARRKRCEEMHASRSIPHSLCMYVHHQYLVYLLSVAQALHRDFHVAELASQEVGVRSAVILPR